MAAYYESGLTIELDLQKPSLFIEGRNVPVRFLGELYESPELPSVSKKSLPDLATEIVRYSKEFAKREQIKDKHLEILRQGVDSWNNWRRENPEIRPILYEIDIERDRFPTDLTNINFSNADLRVAILKGAILKEANFHEANIGQADLSGTNLTGANFCRTDLYETILHKADLTDANLQGTQLARTDFKGAKLLNCKIYGMSAWDLILDQATQRDLTIYYKTYSSEEKGLVTQGQITVDDIQVAQFIYLLLHNANIRLAINAISAKVVLILGSFSESRIEILNEMRDELRQMDYLPILFDFDKPQNRTTLETISTIAGLANFILADLTDAKSVLMELQSIVQNNPLVPVEPILHKSQKEPGMIDSFQQRPNFLEIYEYGDSDELILNLKSKVIIPLNSQMIEKKS